MLIAIKPVLAHVPLGGVWLLLDGGLCYTAGVIFYAWKRLPFSHAIWHLFVLARAARGGWATSAFERYVNFPALSRLPTRWFAEGAIWVRRG